MDKRLKISLELSNKSKVDGNKSAVFQSLGKDKPRKYRKVITILFYLLLYYIYIKLGMILIKKYISVIINISYFYNNCGKIYLQIYIMSQFLLIKHFFII